MSDEDASRVDAENADLKNDRAPIRLRPPAASNPCRDSEEGAILITTEPALEPLNRLRGTWTTDATHPALPGVLVHGTDVIEWLEGERFLIHRARTDHPDFLDSISIVGITGRDRVDNPRNSGPKVDTVESTHAF